VPAPALEALGLPAGTLCYGHFESGTTTTLLLETREQAPVLVLQKHSHALCVMFMSQFVRHTVLMSKSLKF
jgi:hypothetical protein